MDDDFLEKVEVVQRLPGSERHGFQRVLGHGDRQVGLFPQELVQVFEEGAAARENDPAVDDVRGQLGGVCSSAIFTVSTMASICSEMATRISSESMERILGMPDARSRPLTSMVSRFWGSG